MNLISLRWVDIFNGKFIVRLLASISLRHLFFGTIHHCLFTHHRASGDTWPWSFQYDVITNRNPLNLCEFEYQDFILISLPGCDVMSVKDCFYVLCMWNSVFCFVFVECKCLYPLSKMHFQCRCTLFKSSSITQMAGHINILFKVFTSKSQVKLALLLILPYVQDIDGMEISFLPDPQWKHKYTTKMRTKNANQSYIQYI